MNRTSLDDASDEDLLVAVGTGDAGAPLAALYDRYDRRLYGLGRRLLNDEGLAQELVQETFTRVWRVADRFDPSRGNAPAFIFALARNIAVDLYRRPSSRTMDELPTNGSVADQADRLLTGMTVREAMAELSPSHREVLEALYARGERAVDVAERLGVPAATVRTRSFHALKALAASLDRHGIDATLAMS